MPGFAVFACKFIGVYSVGLLTGISFSTTQLALPALLHLSTAAAAASSLVHLRTQTRLYQRFLTATAAASFGLAYILSPRIARHPYLLWTGLLVLAQYPLGSWDAAVRLGGEAETSASEAEEDDEDGVVVGESVRSRVNGEVVQRDVARVQTVEVARLFGYAAAFLMGTVGIWGDSRPLAVVGNVRRVR